MINMADEEQEVGDSTPDVVPIQTLRQQRDDVDLRNRKDKQNLYYNTSILSDGPLTGRHEHSLSEPENLTAASTPGVISADSDTDNTVSFSDDAKSDQCQGDGVDKTSCKNNEMDSKCEDKQETNNDKQEKESLSLFGYFYAELTRGYHLERDEAKFTERRQRVYMFMRIPRELEKFMVFGFFQCVDAFLFIFTFLPLRFLLALFKLGFCSCFARFRADPSRILEPAQICDLLKGIILIISCILMHYVDVSMMYHLIRGQAIIKLYIFFNMLEVADRLFSSFGQDILDSLFWTATEPRGRKREHVGVVPHLALAIVYVCLHTTLVLFQATTLSVAFNSHSKALLTIMMSNNFVELKGSVFKKFEKNNLFQMACSDVRERFHFMVLLFFVVVRNCTEFSWDMDHMWLLFPDVVLIWFSEFLVDWVKHAFITKFNEIPSEVYREYTVSIAYDMASSRQKNAFSDHLDVVSRRMGFIPLPIAVLIVRIIGQSVKISFDDYMAIFLVFLLFLCLITFKILNSIVLMGRSLALVNANKSKSQQKQEEKKETTSHRSSPMRRSHSIAGRLSNVTFSELQPTMMKSESSFTNKQALFSNSTVSLNNVGLNEEYIQDTKKERTPSPDFKPRKKPQKPLHEIDRFSMVSSSIV